MLWVSLLTQRGATGVILQYGQGIVNSEGPLTGPFQSIGEPVDGDLVIGIIARLPV